MAVVAKIGHPSVAERRFLSALRRVVKTTAGIVDAHVDGVLIRDVAGMKKALEDYQKMLDPWARRTSSALIDEVSRMNLRRWEAASKELSRGLRGVFASSIVGAEAREIHRAQVSLITSIPPKAGERAQALAEEAVLAGTRNEEIARKLARTEATTLARARLIARTETAKVNAALTEARAKYVGSTHYVWKTMEDEAVRDAHADLEGEVFAFDDPPYVDGEGYHGPGEFPNCRCWADPILPGETKAERRAA